MRRWRLAPNYHISNKIGTGWLWEFLAGLAMRPVENLLFHVEQCLRFNCKNNDVPRGTGNAESDTLADRQDHLRGIRDWDGFQPLHLRGKFPIRRG